jgi:hypothetical protein
VLDDWSAVSNPIQTRDATPARGKVGVLLVAETPKLPLPAARKQKALTRQMVSASNEVQDCNHYHDQDDDANDPDTSKSSDHRSSFSDAGVLGRGGAQSLHFQREEHTCLTPGQPGRLSSKKGGTA